MIMRFVVANIPPSFIYFATCGRSLGFNVLPTLVGVYSCQQTPILLLSYLLLFIFLYFKKKKLFLTFLSCYVETPIQNHYLGYVFPQCYYTAVDTFNY